MKIKNSLTAIFSDTHFMRKENPERKHIFQSWQAFYVALKKSGCIFLCVFLLLSLMAGCISDGREELLQKAENYLKSEELNRARRILETYLTQDPSSIKAQELQALYFHKTDQFLLEAEAYYRLIQKSADNKEQEDKLEQYYISCAAAYLLLGNKEDALEICQEGAKRLPKSKALAEKAQALQTELEPPHKKTEIAAVPDANGAYAMIEPGEKLALRLAFAADTDTGRNKVFLQKAKDFARETGHEVTIETLSIQKSEPDGGDDFSQPEADLFFVAGLQDLEAMAQAGQLVSLEEMRKELPQLGRHYRQELLAGAGDEKKVYGLPVSVVWTGLYINQSVLQESEVPLPDTAYTWEQFLKDCEAVKNAGYLPIANSPASDFDAWIDWCLLNNGGQASLSGQKALEQKETALQDLKDLYEKGYLRGEEPTIKDTPINLLLQDKAAFLLADAGLYTALAAGNADEMQKLYLIPPPVKQASHAGMILGETSGYWALSRAAWDDPDKRLAALSLYSYLTAKDTLENDTASYEGVLLENTHKEQPDIAKKLLEKSFFPRVTKIYPPFTGQLSPEAQALWKETVSQMLTDELTLQQAAIQMNESQAA